ncbi:long-chain-fatty-acid--CoA ligase [Streptosporangiaceae bacterium NEAU-GS5]|nr:long-chain-fatty-acid--CoA ligase [Streptosporangiaceae bacterium NEAU-GS5]
MTASSPFPPTTIHQAAALHAAERPDATAVLFEDREVTFAELHRESNRAAHALLAAGLSPGARVAYLGKDCDTYFEIALACAKTATVLVPINWRLTAQEIEHIITDSTARLLFVDPDFEKALDGLARPTTVVRLDEPWKDGHPDSALDPGADADQPVLQVYTSGTTGLPKGVVLAHRAFFTFFESMRESRAGWFEWLPDDVSLVSFPASYVAGMAWFMHSFIAGVPNVVMRMFVAEEAVRLTRAHGVTITFAAPAMLAMMLAEPGAGPDAFRSLRKVVYGAAPMPGELLERCMKEMDCGFAQVYASTETGSVATVLPPADHIPGSARLRSVGLPCPGSAVKIVGPSGDALPPGEIGQICVRTPARMVEYWRMPEATARALDGEWLRMGDTGHLDAEGYLFLCDRIDDTIIVAGQNIYPAEVEQALATHPAVADVSVAGVPDARWGEAVHAFVVPRPGAVLTASDLATHLRGRIAAYKAPVKYVFITALPRNPSGKVLRRVLREGITS